MQGRDDPIRNYFHRNDPLRLDIPEETELAYQLQNSTPNDPDVLKRMVRLYAGDLYNWVRVLLYYQKMAIPAHEEILLILKKVFSKALTHVEQFREQAKVSTWLFTICYQMVKRQQFMDWINHSDKGGNNWKENDDLSEAQRPADWISSDHLPGKIRYTIILSYLFDLGIPDITNILNIQAKDAHRRLVDGRNLLFVNLAPSHMETQIQAYVDGLLDEKPDDLNQLMQHLETCDLCRASASKINSLEKKLAESIKKRWLVSALREEELDQLTQSILSEIRQPSVWWNVNLPLRQVVWTLGLSIMFVGLAILFIRITPAERDLPQVDATTTPQLPPIINMPPAITTSISTKASVAAPQYIDPAFSSDGKWAVFASIKTDPTTQAIILPTIEVFNRESNTIQVISESTATLPLPWIWWNLAPSISGDGHWIAYVSSTNDPNIAGNACIAPDHHPCLDIFLYDRETGSTKRVTQAGGGGAANGDSLAPTVSQDGKWVAFWSAANNLVAGVNDTCQQGETNITCLYIFIYSLETGKIDRVPIRNIPGDVVFGVDRISLSADGRYIGFTVTSSEQAGIQPSDSLSTINTLAKSTDDPVINIAITNIVYSSEAIVYDRVLGNYEMENQAQDGTPGNGASSSPILSADGRYVAFASASTNLVQGDVNKYSDVFLRDRLSRAVELISVSSGGKQGNDNSGLTFWGRGFYSVNISNDGRYVVFESAATNLGHGLNLECSRLHANMCNILYVHDRLTGGTELVTALPNQDFSFFSEISADGRWISFMQSFYNCSPTQFFCSNVMLYDRQRGWMTNLTKFDEGTPSLPWSYYGSLVLPWESWESSALAFSPDGKLIALGGYDSTVRIWQISDRRHLLDQNEPDVTLKTQGNDYFSVLAFTHGGEWLAAGTINGTVYIWELSDGRLLYTLKNQTDPIRKLVFSADGAHLVTASFNEAWIWSIDTGQLIKENSISLGITAVYAVDIAPKGNMLASARGDGSVWLQSLPSGKVIGRLGADRVTVSSLTFSEDGSLLATRSSIGTINLWQMGWSDSDTPSVTLISKFQSSGYVGDLAFSPNNKYLASTGMVGEATLWSVPDGTLYTISTSVPNGMAYSVAFSKDSKKLAAVFESEIVLWGITPSTISAYFIHGTSDSYGDSQPQPIATANDILMLREPIGLSKNEHLSLNQAATGLQFPLLVPAHLPMNIYFKEARVNLDGSVWVEYDVSTQESVQAALYIYEKIIGNSVAPTMTIGASAAVIQIPLETASGIGMADYVQGDWTWSRYFNLLDNKHYDSWVWFSMKPTQRLRWQQQGIFIAMYYQVTIPFERVIVEPYTNGFKPLDSLLNKDDLLQIASGMMLYTDVEAELLCYSPGQAETNASKGLETIGGGQFCSSALQEPQHHVVDGEMLIK